MYTHSHIYKYTYTCLSDHGLFITTNPWSHVSHCPRLSSLVRIVGISRTKPSAIPVGVESNRVKPPRSEQGSHA